MFFLAVLGVLAALAACNHTRRRPVKVHVYRDTKGEYRWKAVAGNGRTVDASSEGYLSKGYTFDRAAAYAAKCGGVVVDDT